MPDRRVWACNPRTGEWRLDTVVQTSRREYEGEMVTIVAGGETIRCTAGHPF